MSKEAVIAIYRVAFALLVAAAVATQLIDLAGQGTLNPVNYFSYFTIQSNLIACVVLLLGAARIRGPRSGRFDLVRGGAVVYMSVTGVVFAVLLSGTNVDTAIPWVNAVVHEVMPVVVVLDWLIDPPGSHISARQSLVWLAYPALWLVYTLIRGALVGLYPYPFVNPANGGYGTVAGYCVGILVVMTAVCLLIAWVGSALSRRRGSRHAEASPSR